jgi:hypothetical protein
MATISNDIFNLATDLSQLRTQEKVVKVAYRRRDPKSSSTGKSFPGSNIVFDFTVSGNTWWIPARSYVSMRHSVYQGVANAPAKPTGGGNTALSMNAPACLFDGCDLQVAGVSLGSKSRMLPQIDTVEKRLYKSKAWLDSIGKSVAFWEPDQEERKAGIVAKNKNENIFVPPLGVFKQGQALPPGRYELILRPKPDVTYKKSALHSTGADKDVSDTAGGVLPTDHFDFQIDDIHFNIATVESSERVTDGDFVLDLTETDCNNRLISAGATSESYIVPKSTYALTVALQDRRAGTNTLYPPSLFIAEGHAEKSIERLRVEYAGQVRPSDDEAILFDASSDYLTKRYYQSAIEDGSAFDNGGAITKWDDDYLQMGPIFHHQFRRDGTDASTNVDLYVSYADITDTANLLLFSHSRRVATLRMENGQVSEVLVQHA